MSPLDRIAQDYAGLCDRARGFLQLLLWLAQTVCLQLLDRLFGMKSEIAVFVPHSGCCILEERQKLLDNVNKVTAARIRFDTLAH